MKSYIEYWRQVIKVTDYTAYAKVGQLKVNLNEVMCPMSKKLPCMFGQNPPHTFDIILKKLILMKTALTA